MNKAKWPDLRLINLGEAKRELGRSRLRLVRLTDKEELERLWEIETDEMVKKFVEEVAENQDDLVEFSRSTAAYLVLVVAGEATHVGEDEADKLQGWLTVYPDHSRRLQRLGLTQEIRTLEIGFARHPKAKSGQMAGAVRQVIDLLKGLHPGGVRFTAYANEENEASCRVLEAAGFKKVTKAKYRVTNRDLDWVFVLD